jgi:hypothetical protein
MFAISRTCLLLAGLIALSAAANGADSVEKRPHRAEPPPSASLPQPYATHRFAKNIAGQELEMRDIADPANPYADKYSKLDMWLWEHYVPALSPEEQEVISARKGHEAWETFLAQYPEHWSFARANVDDNGWLIPRSEQIFESADTRSRTIREYVTSIWTSEERLEERDRKLREGYYFNAVGIFPQELWAEDSPSLYRGELRSIPAWLGKSPPLYTVFVPNGEILTYGPLGYVPEGADKPLTPSEYGFPSGELWHRYSAEGKLLGTYKPRPSHLSQTGNWEDVYADWEAFELRLRSAGMVPYGYTFLPLGARAYTISESQASDLVAGHWPEQQLLGAYDYAGNPIDLDAPFDFKNWQVGVPITQQRIVEVFKQQQGL